jgi:hypothetical protein
MQNTLVCACINNEKNQGKKNQYSGDTCFITPDVSRMKEVQVSEYHSNFISSYSNVKFSKSPQSVKSFDYNIEKPPYKNFSKQ